MLAFAVIAAFLLLTTVACATVAFLTALILAALLAFAFAFAFVTTLAGVHFDDFLCFFFV
jgi:hypothetical protein